MSSYGRPLPDLLLYRSETGCTKSLSFTYRKTSLPALNKSHEQTSVTSGNESTTQCVYYSSTLKLEYLSFSAEWLENTSLLRGSGSRPPSHCTEDFPLLCIIDTAATGCSEMIKIFLFYSTPPPPHTLTDPPNAKCKFKRESCYFVRNHPLFSLPLEKLWRLSWSPWKQHDFEGSPELLFKLNCSQEKKTKQTKAEQPRFLF